MKVKSDKGQETKNQLARALADYDNLRKRVEAEKQVWQKFAKQSLLQELLPVLDTIELAQSHLGDKGLEIALTQFREILKSEGIAEIDKAEMFDENIHEAIDTIEGSVKGKIAEVIQKGYRFVGGEIIRPTKVRVYKGEK